MTTTTTTTPNTPMTTTTTTTPNTPMTTTTTTTTPSNNDDDVDNGGCNLCSYGDMVPASIANNRFADSRVTCGLLEMNLPNWIVDGQIDTNTCKVMKDKFRPLCCKPAPSKEGRTVGSNTNSGVTASSGIIRSAMMASGVA